MMQETTGKRRTIGIITIILVIILMKWTILFLVFGTLFGLGSGVSVYAMLPFLILMMLMIAVLAAIGYASIRAVRKKDYLEKIPLTQKQRETVSSIVIIAGIAYFSYVMLVFAINNITGLNPGGQLQPILAFVWCLLLVSFGIMLRKSGPKKEE